MIGKPYNAHDIGKDMMATQRVEARYRIEGCDIYERRIVEYSLNGKDRVVRQDELCFAGDQQVAQRFLENLLSECE